VLVRKTYPKFRKRQKHRIWKLKQLNKEHIDENNIHKKKNKDNGKTDRDMEIFMQDIEEDPELRQQIDIYKNDDIIAELEKKIAGLDLEETK
jgi:nonsense-mediated mRNA decay protein 3